MMDITIIRDAVTRRELNDMAKQQFGDMVKAVVDVEQGSAHKHLWGINLYPERPVPEWIEQIWGQNRFGVRHEY